MIVWDTITDYAGGAIVLEGTHDRDLEGTLAATLYPHGDHEDAVDLPAPEITGDRTWEATIPRSVTVDYPDTLCTVEVWIVETEMSIASGPVHLMRSGMTLP